MKIALNTVKFNTTPILKNKNVVFKGFQCQEDSFEVKRIYNLPCPVCGIPMLQRNQIDSFVNSCQNAKGEELVELISKYRKYLHETEKSVADVLTLEAEKHSDMDILELAQNIAGSRLANISQQQIDALNRIQKMSGSIISSKKEEFNKLIEEYVFIAENHAEKFNKKDFIDKINDILSANNSAKKKILKTAERIPTTNDSDTQFFVKYSQKTKAEFASRLVTPSLATCEHIKPKSVGGADNTENYLAECQECNSKRNDTPFGKWVANIGSFASNFSNYIQTVSKKIESGEISAGYITYPSDVVKTVSDATSGKIKPGVQPINLTEHATEINTEAKIKQLEKNIQDNIQALLEAKALRTKAKDNPQFSLLLEYRNLTKEKEHVIALRKTEKQNQAKLKDIINGYYSNNLKLQSLQNKFDKTIGAKEKADIRGKILAIKKNMQSVNIEEKEQEYERVTLEIESLENKTADLNIKISAVIEQIDTPEKYLTIIRDIKTKLFELEQLNKEANTLIENIAMKQELIQTAQQKNRRIEELVRINASLNPVDEGGNNIEEYNTLSYMISRANALKEKSQKTSTKEFVDVDIMIYDFAQIMAQDKIEKLSSSSEAVRHNINLKEIALLTEELQKLYLSIEQFKLKEKDLRALYEKINTMESQESLNQQLSQAQEKLNQAREVAAAVDIERKIQNLEKEIMRKTGILNKLKDKNLPKEELFRLLAEI